MERHLLVREVRRVLEIDSSEAQGRVIVACCPDGDAGEGENYHEKDGDAARCLVSLRSDEGDQRSDNESGDEAANVCSIIGDAVRSEEVGQESPREVEGNKYKQTSECAGQRGARHRELTQLESCDERTSEPEDGA